MKRFLLITSVLAVAAFALIARAQTTELKARFDAYDINKDGEISGDEMQAAPILPKLDLDADGKLTLIEAAKALRQKIPEATPTSTGTGDRRLFDFLDKDKDGKLTAEEMPKKQWFDRLDTNSDGSITFEEADSVVAQMKARGESIPRIPGAPESPAAPASEPKTEDLTESPLILKGSDHGVGRLVTDLSLGDKKLSAHLTDSKGTILAFFGATCPISGKLGPELARLEKDASAQQVRMILVCPVSSETADDIQKFVTTHALKSPIVHDKDGLISAALTATTTTEVFLIDSARTLTYRGAINDQYGLGYTKEQPTKTYLRDAMVAMLASTATEIAATTAPGCALDLKKATSIAQTSVTYHHQIERIMQANCLECHRKGSVGPFSLESYEDVIENAGMIRKQVERGVMPPWFAAEPPAGQDTLGSMTAPSPNRIKATSSPGSPATARRATPPMLPRSSSSPSNGFSASPMPSSSYRAPSPSRPKAPCPISSSLLTPTFPKTAG
jgi:Ca2+-binding EF-hand superfamily protein/mono/diheme cytochrome c family protein/peroxiredoxin